ncbi:hypothetical protein, conserved [Leishmania tarentolae]|uniref:Uncharacterized protein n=1 Tax=Leishmania tarentolae TaxID=5689 RepID=A0A640KSE1_LEITA|nr:hypothetical protein, conserved [Leishmania tarentolae]
MLEESTSRSQGGKGGGHEVTGDNAFSRSTLSPGWAPSEASSLHQRWASLTPHRTSMSSSPLLGFSRLHASQMPGHSDEGLRGAGARAPPQSLVRNPRSGVPPPRTSMSRSMLLPSLSHICYPPQGPQAQNSDFPITPTVATIISSSPCHSPTTEQILMSSASSSPSRRPVRLALGAFCMLNAGIAFLFTWMMHRQQISFALTAVKRRWDLKERSNAIFKAGVYYLIIGLVLLIDRLSLTVAVIFQLCVRFLRARAPSILRWLHWCARKVTASRLCGSLLGRLVPHTVIASSENYRGLMLNRVVQPLQSSGASVPPVGAPMGLSSHGLLPRFSGSQLGSSLSYSQTNWMSVSMPDVEVNMRPSSAATTSLNVRRRVS